MTLIRRFAPIARTLFSLALATACGAIALASSFPANAATCNIAVAANFTEPAREIAQIFETKTGHKALLSFGATGQFYAQMTQAAPFEACLSADERTPTTLVDGGLAAGESLLSIAVGKLVVISAQTGLV